MLPYGDLREHKSNMRRADVILITKCPENLNAIQRRLFVKEIGKAPYQNLYFTTLSYKAPLPVFDLSEKDSINLDLEKCASAKALLLTGIANPKPLNEYLQKFFGEITELRYPDHFAFKEKDISDISAAFNAIAAATKYIITTEKDAIRLREFSNMNENIKAALFYIPVGINFLNDDKAEFDNLIIDYVRNSKQNIRISKR
jgi:tetraacyldisaccharide 4'-kinase